MVEIQGESLLEVVDMVSENFVGVVGVVGLRFMKMGGDGRIGDFQIVFFFF